MLAIPEKGFAYSAAKHNVDLDICTDWIEANALFTGAATAGSEIVDALVDGHVYADQDLAWQLFDIVCSQIAWRSRCMGESYPIGLEGKRVVALGDWKHFRPYGFCLTLSLARAYPAWARSFVTDYTDQGALFEELSEESLRRLLPDWAVSRTGWAKEQPKKLRNVIEKVAKIVGEEIAPNFEKYLRERSNDEGLDVVCHRDFPDGRGAHVAYLVQCASGGNWEAKLHTPIIDLWAKLIDFPVLPRRGFSVPFGLAPADFQRNSTIVQGIFLDRHRLLCPGRGARDWIPDDLAERLLAWLLPRVTKLPRI